MWFEFAIAVLTLSAILIIPGYLLLRVAGLPRTWSLCFSPLLSTGVLCLTGEVLARTPILASPFTILIPPLAVIGIMYLVTRKRLKPVKLPDIAPWLPFAFVAVAIVVGWKTYLTYVLAPDNMLLMADYPHHASEIQSILDSGRFSSLNVSFYSSAADRLVDPFGTEGGFYPSAWHILCALAIQICGASTPIMINAAYFTFSTVVYPMGALGLLAMLFPDDRRTVVLGTFCAVGLVIFPWAIVMIGPVFANHAGLAAMPVAMCLFMHLTAHDVTPAERAKTLGLLALAMIGLTLLHPNTVFSMAVLLIPYCASRLFRSDGISRGKLRLSPRTSGALFLAACAALWVVCYKLPMFQSLVNYNWDHFTSWEASIENILTLTFVDGKLAIFGAQLLYGVLVVIGIVRAARSSEHRWVAFAYAFVCLQVFLTTTTEGTLKHLLCGFWYTDPYRIAATACIIAVPLASLGMSWMAEKIERLVERLHGDERAQRAVVVIVCSLLLFVDVKTTIHIPGHEPYLKAFGTYEYYVRGIAYTSDPYSRDARGFVESAKQITGDSLVINDPMDGSFLAYGVNGMRTYYRDFAGFADDSEMGADNSETQDSIAIRTKLNLIGSDEEVKKAVDDIGAKYVITLDDTLMRTGNFSWFYRPEDFIGVRSITESTPGFKLVLRDGNMSLYEIVE